ncbi:hypothetical protein ACRXB1_06775, partial [Caballeronia sp. M23-90]
MLSFLLKLRTRAQRRFRFSEAHTMLVWAVISFPPQTSASTRSNPAHVLSFLLKLRTRAQRRFRFSEAHTM